MKKLLKNKNKYLFFSPKQFSKFVVVLVVISIFSSVITINPTSAYFSDSVTVSGNTFTAGTLSINLNNTNTFSSGLLYPNDSTSTSMDISNTGSLDSQYVAATTPIGSDNSACDYIMMTASNGTYTKTGLIKDFTSDTISTTNATWNYNFTVSPTAPPSVWDKTCYFSWKYTAWQTNLSDASTGFTSVKEKSGAIKVGKAVVLNEILYNPKSTDPAPANKEFIELFNNSNVSFDLAGWQVSEISGSTEQKYTITTTATPVSYRAVPYSGSTTISPKGWMTLQLSAGNALNDTGDTVRLYDASSNKLDEYTYKGGKLDGFSEARIPDGVGAWVDPIPTPDATNELIEEIIPVVEEPVVTEEVKSDTITETEDATPEAVVETPSATEPEEVITKETEIVEAPISEVIEPVIIKTVEPVVTELVPVISETEPILESDPVVETSAVESAPVEPVSNEIK